jgi:hypothetical protein
VLQTLWMWMRLLKYSLKLSLLLPDMKRRHLDSFEKGRNDEKKLDKDTNFHRSSERIAARGKVNMLVMNFTHQFLPPHARMKHEKRVQFYKAYISHI